MHSETTGVERPVGRRAPRPTRRRRRVALGVLLAALMTLAACGGDDDSTSGTDDSTSGTDDSTSGTDDSTSGTDDSTSGTDALSDGGSSGQPTAGGTLTMLRTGPTPANWDPTDPSSDGMTDPSGTGAWMSAVYGVLAYEDLGSGEVVPSMAESIATEDGRTWTLTLREDMTFSDGTPFDAEAVKFNWERHSDAELASAQAGAVEAIAQLQAVDPVTLEISLTEPNSQFDRVVARNLPFVGSPTAIRDDLDAFRQRPVGGGPFLLDDYGAGQEATFVRNDRYWDAPRPYLDELVLRNIEDDEQRYNSFATGQGDLIQIFRGYSHLDGAEDAGYQLFENSLAGGTSLVVNHTRPPFDDVEARRALARMLDVELKTQTADLGATSPIETIFPEDSPYHVPGATLPRYDPELAQQLISDIAARTGGPLSFELYVYDGVSAVGELYQAQLNEFDDLDVGLNLVSANEYVPGIAQGAFDAAIFPMEFADPVDAFAAQIATDGQLNFGRYSNPEMDALITEAKASLSLDERVAIFEEIQSIFIEDLPLVFLSNTPEYQLATQAVRDVHYALNGIPRWAEIWLDG